MTWQVIGETWALYGTGPAPRLVVGPEGPESPVPPPPPVVPPPPVLIEDDRPFDWPPQSWRPYQPEQRYAALGLGFYAGERRFENPQPASHREAGIIQAGHIGSWNLMGYTLWVPSDARPSTIRRALATGHL